MAGLYNRLNFNRVYFSAYQKGLGDPGIPGEKRPAADPGVTFMREHRLYQVDFLLRKYGFQEGEIPLDRTGNLPLERDPKQVWADNHPGFYPVRINASDKETLLRVPGLGPETVRQILRIRRERKIGQIEDLRIRGKRAEKLRRYLICE